MTFEEWYDEVGVEWIQHKNVARRAWDARVPEGYVLVPEDPTEAMLKAGSKTFERGGYICAIYRAMVRTAQEEL